MRSDTNHKIQISINFNIEFGIRKLNSQPEINPPIDEAEDIDNALEYLISEVSDKFQYYTSELKAVCIV